MMAYIYKYKRNHIETIFRNCLYYNLKIKHKHKRDTTIFPKVIVKYFPYFFVL